MASDFNTGRVFRLVVAAVVLDDLEHPTALLRMARFRPPGYASQSELPGGKVELAERPEQALARELDKEIGLGIRLGPEPAVPRQLTVAAPPNNGPGDDAPAWPVTHGFRMRVWLVEPAHPGERGRVGGDHQYLERVCLDLSDQLRRLPWLEADLPIIDAPVGALGR